MSNPQPKPASSDSLSTQIIDRAKAHLLQNYRQQPIVVERGEGVHVWDVEGRRYLDLIGGIATVCVGHRHPTVLAAAKAQLDKVWHLSNIVYHQPNIDLAERLCRGSGLDRVFFCNSGAEANEAMVKLARRFQHDRGQTERVEIVAFEGSFHGRTLGMISATGQPKYRKGFEPVVPGFHHARFGDLDSVRALVGSKTAAILVEPVQGESGVRPLPEGFLAELRKLCDQEGALLLLDEVQTGMGRTGHLFAFQGEGVKPDAISLAKALGNGLPVGAMLCTEETGKVMVPGTHGSTFGGNPVACAAACAVYDLVSDPAMLASVRKKGEHLRASAKAIQARHPDQVVEVRGRGLLMGIEVTQPGREVVARCLQGGLLLNLAGEKTVRFAPPFVVTEDELDEGLAIFERALVG